MLMVQYSMQTGVTSIPVYPVKSDNSATSAAAPLFVPQPATLSTQSSSPLPAPTIAIVVLICLVVLSYFYSETARKRAKPPSE